MAPFYMQLFTKSVLRAKSISSFQSKVEKTIKYAITREAMINFFQAHEVFTKH